jgi:hypothetical protein
MLHIVDQIFCKRQPKALELQFQCSVKKNEKSKKNMTKQVRGHVGAQQ